MPKVIAPIIPASPTDSYPTHDSKYGLGGYREVLDITERDLISSDRRREGMSVFVQSEGVEYKLIGGILNSNWVGSSSKSGIAIIDFGATPTDNGSVVITGQSGIMDTSGIQVSIMARSTIDNDENSQPFISGSLHFSAQSINTGVVSGTPSSMKMGNIQITLADLQNNKSYPAMQSGKGLSGYQGQNGQTQGQNAQWSNTAEPTAATATNTTAALGSGLGGLFKANAMATSGTDLIIQSFQNPVPTLNITGRNLHVRGVRIDLVNQVVQVATTPFTFAIALAVGHTAVSLATVESASFATGTTKAPRKIPLGFLHLPIGAVDGESARDRIYIKFDTPIVVYPSQFIAIVAKVIKGTATTPETLLFSVGYDSYWE
ncbi:MAG: hypothetical protein HS129_04910 [Leptospiraceae bacterium]|nr:hypothetical protein [Leptospiraceae bacterium]